jgi:signal transduction histidine kinase
VRLTRKLVAALVVAIVVVMAADAALQLRREIALFEDDMARDEEATGRVLQVAVERMAAAEGVEAALAVFDLMRASETRVNLRWLWLDAPNPADRVPDDLRPPLAAGETAHVERTDAAGDERQFTYVPLRLPGDHAAALELSEPLHFQRSFLRQTAFRIFGTLIVMVTIGAAITLWIGVVFVGRPMRELTAQARRIGAGDLSRRLALAQRDEIATLAHELNVTCDRLAAANERVRAETEARIAALDQLRHADRLKTIGQLASAVAHELGTPLTVVGSRAKLIASGGFSRDEVGENARIITAQTERMAAIIRQLLDFARRRTLDRTVSDLRDLVRHTADMLVVFARGRGVSIRLDLPDAPLLASMDQGALQQALTNVLVNGIQAMDDGGTLRVRVEPDVSEAPDRPMHRIVIEDDGTGITPEHLPHVFEPFFTTKGVGEGTGLGLAVAYGIVGEHGGRIDVTSRLGDGTRFDLVLPGVEAVHRAKAV